ncbi:MAG: hypothetical protein HY684_01570 [Chloroflexi bacterium]|nr:hypothetical protein [Chloroflexota bacterium]
MTHSIAVSRVLGVVVVAALVAGGCAPAAAPGAPPAAPVRPTAAPTAPAPPVQALPRVETPTPAPSRPAPATPTPASRPAGEQPRHGGILTAYESSEPTSLDVNQETTIFTLQNQASVYNGLLQVDPIRLPDRVITGDLAEKWSVSQDAKTWTFTLKGDVTFQDGKPLTSADVAFTLDRMKTGPGGIKAPFKVLFEAIDKVEAPDGRTVRVQLKRPVSYFAVLMAHPAVSIMPKHILEKDQHALEQKSLGSGPFRFKAWNRNVSIELERNPNYFKKGLPYLDGIRWITLREPATQVAALRTGRVVFGGHGTRGLSKREADLLGKDIPGVQISRYSTDSVQYLLVNTRKKPLDDIRVRKAIFNALSQENVINTAYQGAGFRGDYIGPGEWQLPQAELNKMPPYRGPTPADLDEGKKLLAEAGFPKGLTLEMLQPHLYEPMTLTVAADLRKVGVETKIRVVQYPVEWLPLVTKGNYDLSIGPTVLALYDPDGYLKNALKGDSENYTGESSPEVDALYQKQTSIVDFAERKKVADQLQLKVWEQRGHFPTFYVMYFQAALPQVKGWKGPGRLRDNFRYEGIWLAQ